MKKYIPVLLLAFLTSNISSQIVYTDVIPDDTLVADYVSDSHTIDFDGDLNPELVIFSTKQDTVISGFPVTLTGLAISTLGSTEIISSITTIGNEDVVVADTISHGQLIGPMANYLSSATPSVFPGVGLGIQANLMGLKAGDFINNGKLFVGVKFDISANVHYGWIQISIDSAAVSGIVYDFAYQSIADSTIYAGAIENDFVNVSTNDLSDINIYSAHKKLHFVGSVSGTLSMFNLLGKQVLNKKVNSNEVINVAELNKGIYLVSFTAGASTITKKVFID